MGNRYDDPRTQTDQTEQRRDVQPVDGPNRFQTEAYGNQSRGDKVSQTQQFVKQELQGVLGHLQNAEDTYEQRGVRAATGEYTAAIRAADSIDQQAVARERENVRQMLQSGNLDAQTRKALVQEDADLHTLQRAPGFARANFALLMIRNGDQYYGTQLLLEAQQKDPEMNQDPNFQRHLKNAVDAAPGARQSMDQGQNQYQPTDAQSQQQQQRLGDQQQQQQRQGDQTIGQPAQITDNGQQQQRMSPLDAQNRTPVEAVQNLFSSVTGPGTMTPEIKQQFQQAIANADAGQSPKMQALLQAEAQAAQAVRPLADQNLVKAVTAQDQAAQQLIGQMPQDKQAAVFQLYNAMDKASTPQERHQIQQQLVQANPGLQQVLATRDQAMGAQNIQALMNYMQVENSVQAEKNQAAITRFTYGLALAKNGDAQEAKQFVADAVKMNNSQDPELRAYWQRTAAQMGVPTDAAANPQQPGDVNSQQQQAGGTAADALKAVEEKFQKVVAEKGDVKAAYQQLAPEFQAAIQKSDGEFAQTAKTLTARDQQLQAEITAKLTPEVKQQMQQIGATIDAEKAKLTPADQQLFAKYQNPATSDADRQAIHAQFEKNYPNLTKAADQLEQTIGKDTMGKIAQLAADQAQMQSAIMGRFLTRYYMADAAQTAGDTQAAQAQMTAAFQAVPAEFQQAFAQKPDVQALAQKSGLDLTKLPAPADQVLAGSGLVQDASATPRPGQDQAQQPGATTDAAGNVAGNSPENQGLRPDQIMSKAAQMLQTEGMTAATKKQFEDGVRAADALYGPQDKQMTDQLLNVVTTGKKADGTDLSAAERLQAHGLIQQEFQRATLGMQYRLQYATALNGAKQFASAEKVFKENVANCDKLPLDAFQKELNQLGKDVQNPQLSRANQADLFSFMQDIQGSGTSKDNGLLYLPITARKQAALFYVAGSDGSSTGLVKPEQASAMIDEARAKEKQLYGVTDDKAKAFDPTLAKMAEGIQPLLPENIRKQKAETDSFWSNAPVDAGAAALAIGGTMAIVGLLKGNGTLAKIGMETAEGTLSIGGKLAVGGTMIGTATLARQGLHTLATGQSEDWSTSLIHGTAGVAAVGGILATRSAASKFLYGAADEVKTLGAVDAAIATKPGILRETAQIDDLVGGLTSGGRKLNPGALDGIARDAKVFTAEGKLTPEAAQVMSRYSVPQIATLTNDLGKVADAGGVVTKPGIVGRVTGAFTGPTMKSWATGYAGAFGGSFTYNSVSSLDRPIDPKTGQPIGYFESFVKSNYSDVMNNTAVNALWLAPFLKDGVIAQNLARDSKWGTVKSFAGAPFKPSTFGSMGADAWKLENAAQVGRQAAQLSIINTFANFNTYAQAVPFWLQSRQYGKVLNQMEAPITDQAAPKATAPAAAETQVLNTQPAGQTDAVPQQPKVQDNGQPIADQPVENQQQQQQQQQGDLTQGTPGLPQ